MDQQAEKLIVALMVLLEQKGGEITLGKEEFQNMFDVRHSMGIQVNELGEDSICLKLGEMTVNPDDAAFN